MTHRTVRALVLEGPKKMVVREFPRPEIGDDDALLAVEACGLCGTDHEQWSGVLPAAVPMIPGHETVGTITEIGPVAAARWGLGVGDRVAVEAFQSCLECNACRSGRARVCERRGMYCYGQQPTSVPPALWGGYAEMQYLGPGSLLQPVPASVDPVVAATFNAIAAGYRWGVSAPGTGAGDKVAVLGVGVRGLSAAIAARDAGASFVMVSGFGERDAPRLAVARDMGIDLVVDSAATDPVAAFERAAGGLADIVLDATANAPSAFKQAIELAAPDGRVVMAGTRGTIALTGFQPDLIVQRSLRIQGVVGVDTVDYQAAVDLLASGRYAFDAMPSRTAGFDDLDELMAVISGETGEVPPLRAAFVPR
jgi:alcohol dehydrogenase